MASSTVRGSVRAGRILAATAMMIAALAGSALLQSTETSGNGASFVSGLFTAERQL